MSLGGVKDPEGRFRPRVRTLAPRGVLGFLSLQGSMQVLVTYGGDPIPKSPFTVGVAAPLDLSKIKINGLENSKYVNGGETGHRRPPLGAIRVPQKDSLQRINF